MIAIVEAAALASAAHQRGVALSTALRAKDQALLDAIAPGDRALWVRTLTPDAVYVDENGAVMEREAFLKTLEPLPAGASGHIAIVDYELKRHGDTALVIHRDDEREDYHGHALHADYLMTEAWRLEAGGWPWSTSMWSPRTLPPF